MTDVREPDTTGRSRPNRLPLWIAAGGVAVVIAAFALYWFQPWKAFIDERVSEERPTNTVTASDQPSDPVAPDGTTAGDDDAPENAEPDGPAVLATGEFIALDKGTTGTVEILQLDDGSRVVWIEDLDTQNGPDLFVYLSTNPADGPKGAFKDDYINLGTLKGNKGSQSYDLPTDLDWEHFTSVVIYCDRFTSPFGAANLDVA